MEVEKAINERRAVKHFDPNHKMSEEEIKKLLSLAILSPTAFNIQNWRFLLIKDTYLLQKIREAAWNQAQITDASLLIILCADLKSFEKEPKRYWRNAPEPVQDFILPALDEYYRNKDQVQRDEAMRSTGIAAQTIMLAAKSMGYDTCPMDGFDYKAVGDLLELPADHEISMFIAVGKATSEAWPRGGQLDLSEVVKVY